MRCLLAKAAGFCFKPIIYAPPLRGTTTLLMDSLLNIRA
jgi:hypothetical protein